MEAGETPAPPNPTDFAVAQHDAPRTFGCAPTALESHMKHIRGPWRWNLRRASRCVVIAACLGALASCAGGGETARDPLAEARDEKVVLSRRVAAVDRAATGAIAGEFDAGEVREALKALAWEGSAPVEVRVRAVQRLLEDEANLEDTRRMMRLMLPHEPHLGMVHVIGDVAVARGWTEVTPALVRRYARPARTIDDADRPERAALMALHPGQDPAEIAFAVFLDPGESEGIADRDWKAVTRADAWDLAARLDRDGSVLASLLESMRERNVRADDEGRAVLAELERCSRDLRTRPRVGRELVWMSSLMDPRNTANAAWWRESSQAVAHLSDAQREGLRLRHIEAVRWAAAHRPAWISLDREGLLEELDRRLTGRRWHGRAREPGETGPLQRERYEDARDHLSWGDALSVLVIDELLRGGGLAATLFAQVEQDRADRTTEYGGLFFAGGPGGEARFEMYPPRPAQRVGDQAFIASIDMIAASDLALAHYHFHAQHAANSRYAGPSREDLAYAARFGRTCLVITSIRADVLNIDVYTPDGIVVDLGEFVR